MSIPALDHVFMTSPSPPPAGNLEESEEALKLSEQHDGLFSTVGVHPTRAGDIFRQEGDVDEQAYIAKLLKVAEAGAGKVSRVEARHRCRVRKTDHRLGATGCCHW